MAINQLLAIIYGLSGGTALVPFWVAAITVRCQGKFFHCFGLSYLSNITIGSNFKSSNISSRTKIK